MNNSIQATPSANAGVQQSKTTSIDSAADAASNDDSGGFTAALASVESESDNTEQQLDGNNPETAEELLTPEQLSIPEQLLDGNTLPAEEQMAMWQALMLIQPAGAELTQSVTPKLQSMDLLNSQRMDLLNNQRMGLLNSEHKPLSSSSQFNADYFNTMIMQNKDAATSLPAGFATNNINMQLAAAQFNPETKEGILFNLTESITPTTGASSTLMQSLGAVGLGTVTQAAATQTQMAPLNLGQNAWESNLGSRLQMMVGQNVQTAEIRLDPPELGALDIKIKISNDVASVNITSAHAQVREALEAAVPKLREMFAESGVSLGDVNVRQESFAQQQGETAEEDKSSGQLLDIENVDEEQSQVARKIVSSSLLDTYA